MIHRSLNNYYNVFMFEIEFTILIVANYYGSPTPDTLPAIIQNKNNMSHAIVISHTKIPPLFLWNDQQNRNRLELILCLYFLRRLQLT